MYHSIKEVKEIVDNYFNLEKEITEIYNTLYPYRDGVVMCFHVRNIETIIHLDNGDETWTVKFPTIYLSMEKEKYLEDWLTRHHIEDSEFINMKKDYERYLELKAKFENIK